MNQSRKLRCQKLGHKQNQIMFVCINQECTQSKVGCLQCFPDHDGHTKQNLDIDLFFEKVYQKDKKAEQDINSVFNTGAVKKYKETLIRQIQQQFKSLNSKIFQYLDRHQDQVVNFIAQKNLQDIGLSLKLRQFHDDLMRIRAKPQSQLDNRDINYLLQFIQSDEYDNLLEKTIQQRNNMMSEFSYDMSQISMQFDFQFNQLMQQMDSWVIENLQPNNIELKNQAQDKIEKSTPLKHKRQSSSKSPFQTPGKNSRNKTPDNSQQKQNQSYSNLSKLLYTSPEKGNYEFIQKDKQLESLIQYCLVNYLKEDYINENIQLFQTNYPDYVNSKIVGKEKVFYIGQKDRLQLIYDNKANLLFQLWDNWMVEWLRPAIPINVINIKVHELEENFNSFFELLDKSLKIHEIVIWLIKQKVNKPRLEYQSWLLIGQKANKHYRLYNIKPSQKKMVKEFNYFDEPEQQVERVINQFPKMLQEHLGVDFSTSKDIKIIIKGQHDPNYQTYLLCERLQVFLNLITNQLVTNNFSSSYIEKNIDMILVNFKSFVTYLSLSLKEQAEL
ncbi:hypothetical protein pb186bvf_002417 [Paramecium bursaria]